MKSYYFETGITAYSKNKLVFSSILSSGNLFILSSGISGGSVPLKTILLSKFKHYYNS